MSALPPCPKCQSTYTYEDGALLVCPECAHEWSPNAAASEAPVEEAGLVVRDAYGTVLHDGDSVTIVKDLKVKGATSALKVGTKVRAFASWKATTTSTARSTASARWR